MSVEDQIEIDVEKLANVIIAHSPAIQAGIKTADQILWFFTRWILTASLIIAFGLASLLTLIIHK